MANELLFNARFDISKKNIKPFYDKEFAKWQKMKREWRTQGRSDAVSKRSKQ